MTVLAQNIRHRREELGLSQEALAAKIGAHRIEIHKLECMKYRFICPERLTALSEALQIDDLYLFLSKPISTKSVHPEPNKR